MDSRGDDGYRGSDGAGDGRGPAASLPRMAEIVASANKEVDELRPHSVGRTISLMSLAWSLIHIRSDVSSTAARNACWKQKRLQITVAQTPLLHTGHISLRTRLLRMQYPIIATTMIRLIRVGAGCIVNGKS
jgi:hypothetical protein